MFDLKKVFFEFPVIFQERHTVEQTWTIEDANCDLNL